MGGIAPVPPRRRAGGRSPPRSCCSSRSTSSPSTTLRGSRIDLTENGLYTLSQGTRQRARPRSRSRSRCASITRRSSAPRRRLTASMPSACARCCSNTPRWRTARSSSRRSIPQPFSPAEDRAVAFGLQGVPLEQGGEQVYFGLAATNSTDDQQTIPFFQPERERFLEYDLTKLVYSLAFPKKTVVGLLSSAAARGRFRGGDARRAADAVCDLRADEAALRHPRRLRPTRRDPRPTSTC